MKSFFFFASLLIIVFVPSALRANSEDWKVSVGGISFYSPVSPGVDDYEFRAFPFIDVDYRDRYFLNFQKGLGLTLFGDERSAQQLDLAIGVDFGRDESDSLFLQGLGDLDESIEARLFYVFRFNENWSLGATIAHGLNSNGHEGAYAVFSFNWMKSLKDKGIFLTAGPYIRVATSDYMQAYYGVTVGQSISSGYTVYSPDGGLESYGLNVFISKQFDENWSIFAQFDGFGLSSEATDSPYVTEDYQASILGGVSYGF